MAAAYDPTDVHGLLQLAVLVDDFWHAETPRERQAANAEIRLQGVRFGLSPIDRRRLPWEIERSEEAPARGRCRRVPRPLQDAPTGPTSATDPRSILRPVPDTGGS